MTPLPGGQSLSEYLRARGLTIETDRPDLFVNGHPWRGHPPASNEGFHECIDGERYDMESCLIGWRPSGYVEPLTVGLPDVRQFWPNARWAV